jgi:hypothetical protein
MKNTKLVKTRVLLLASYCRGENEKCSEELPCEDCLKVCNVLVIELPFTFENLGGIDYLREKETI